MKKILYIITFIFLGFISINNIKAGSLRIKGSSSVYVGNTIKVTVNFNNIAGRFKISSSNESILAGGNDDFYDNQSATFTFTAKSEGTATITVSPVGAIGDYDNDVYTGGGRSLTVKVLKKVNKPSVDVNKVYSKNNYLKSLNIDGYELTPKFNKETLEYQVELDPGTEKINVSATKEDTKARIKGIGEIKITEGINTINITVTAENGNERVYKIIANSPEKDPINIKIDNKDYTVIKKKELLTIKDGYEESNVRINDFDIPSLYNSITKVTLVGVKDEEGNIILVSYDSKTDEYKFYNEFKFDLMNLYIIEKEDSEYEKISLRINDINIVGYKIEGLNDYCLLYGVNTITGYEGYYLYDVKENSIQRYNSILLDNVIHTKDKYLSIVLVLSCVCFLTMLFLLIEVNRDYKRKIEE